MWSVLVCLVVLLHLGGWSLYEDRSSASALPPGDWCKVAPKCESEARIFSHQVNSKQLSLNHSQPFHLMVIVLLM